MKSVSDHIRAHLLQIAPDVDSDSYAALQVSEWSVEFEQLMRNRLIMGSIRYNKMATPRKPGCTIFHIEIIEQRLKRYKETGNLEMLVDIANLCKVEFVHSDHPDKHFKAVERK